VYVLLCVADLNLELMCNPWQRDGEPVVRVERPLMRTLFELCCNALAADDSLLQRITSTFCVRTHARTY
jgi:hypothetical protein